MFFKKEHFGEISLQYNDIQAIKKSTEKRVNGIFNDFFQ